MSCLLAYQVGLSVCVMNEQQHAVFHMLLVVYKLPQLATAVEVPHLEFAIVASSQQATLLHTIQTVSR